MSIIFAILIFSFLIFIHELGHFVAAKLSGVQVNEFALFMGPAIWKKQVGETLYAIRLIPIGGYCAMEGEDGDSNNPKAFTQAAWWKRLIILIAGAFMNFVEERICRDGIVASEDVLKVDAFLNHQIDMELVEACAQEFVRRFEGTSITRVLTMWSKALASAERIEAVMAAEDQLTPQNIPETHEQAHIVFENVILNGAEDIFAYVSLTDMQAVLVSGPEIEIRAGLNVKAIPQCNVNERIVTDIKISETNDFPEFGIIIYNVQRNDSLWDICKKYGVDEEDVIKLSKEVIEEFIQNKKIFSSKQYLHSVPSIAELCEVYKNKDVIQTSLTKVNGFKFGKSFLILSAKVNILSTLLYSINA